MELKYRNVIDHLIHIFTLELYQEGQKLPTETKLMEDLGVGRNTVRKAILEMEKEGIVIRRQGSGTFYVSHVSKRTKAGGLIGIANFEGLGYIYPEIIKGVENALYDDGYSLVLASNNIASIRDLSSLRILLDQNIKGLILDLSRVFSGEMESPVLSLIQDSGIPVVTTHWDGLLPNSSAVCINDEVGGYIATKHLIQNGHKKIAFIYKNVQAGHLRLEGYKRAHIEAGLLVDMELVLSFEDKIHPEDAEYGYMKTEELIDKGFDFTAIFYFNDLIAMEGYKVFSNRGIKIPEDVSVIGFDNFQHSQHLSPGLTTMNHPKDDLGYWAAKLLLKDIELKGTSQPKRLFFDPVLIERDSVKNIT
ncbi:MAG: GntR family transcriptional regulator [Spirochaetaceae bacterium]